MQYYRTSSIHKWFWLHLSALYTANKSIPSYWWWCTGCVVVRLESHDHWILNYDPSFRLSHGYEHSEHSKNERAEKKKHDRRLKSSVARLLKLTTYWILRTEHWSQCLYTRLFHHIRFHRYTDCGIHSLSHTLSFHCFHSVRILLLFLCLCCLFFVIHGSGFTMSTTVWKRRVKEFS